MKIKFTSACLPSVANSFTDFEKGAVCVALSELYNDRWFDLTTFDKLADILQAQKQDNYKFIAIMHCKHWDKMDELTRNGLIETSLSYLGVDINVIDVECEVIPDKPSEGKASSKDVVDEYNEKVVIITPRTRLGGIRRLLGFQR